MPDDLQLSTNKNAETYARLLRDSVNGHALWDPVVDETDTGNVGDCGYIEDGIFHKIQCVVSSKSSATVEQGK